MSNISRFRTVYICVGKLSPDSLLSFYYTGRSGDKYASPDKEEAFTYDTYEAADNRCTTLNRGSSITHITWTAKSHTLLVS
jgi:hypothetical protein